MTNLPESLELTEITATMLPLFVVETLRNNEEWGVFTVQPFRTSDDAQKHLELMLHEYPSLKPEQVRVGAYTLARWREDLLAYVLDDREATKVALSLLSNETLVDILKRDCERLVKAFYGDKS